MRSPPGGSSHSVSPSLAHRPARRREPLDERTFDRYNDLAHGCRRADCPRRARAQPARTSTCASRATSSSCITGLSGSGKSSLAFDTIYAEGQRRYVESLSAYARQFLDQMSKPDVDSIDGLSPAISIEQRSVAKNPRSTVGTITEIHDHLRLLYARVGQPHCWICGEPIASQTVPRERSSTGASSAEGVRVHGATRRSSATARASSTRSSTRSARGLRAREGQR